MNVLSSMGALFLLLSLPLSAKPLEGIWGGKWDDVWPVFIEIYQTPTDGEYKFRYYWLENTDDAAFSHEDLTAHKVGHHFVAGKMTFILDDQSGMIHGQFETPRMANLVRIDSPKVKIEEVNLPAAGWKPGAVPADEALTKILAGKTH